MFTEPWESDVPLLPLPNQWWWQPDITGRRVRIIEADGTPVTGWHTDYRQAIIEAEASDR